MKIILLGRFGLAESMLSCAEEIGGRQKGVFPLDSKPGDSEAIFARELKLVLDNAPGSKLLLIDQSLGAFPNLCRKMTKKPDIRVVSGFNLAMLLGLFECRKQGIGLEEMAEKAVHLGRQDIRML